MKRNLLVQPGPRTAQLAVPSGFLLSIVSPSPICTFSSPPKQRKRRSSGRKAAPQGTEGCHSSPIPGEVTFRGEEEAQSRMRKARRSSIPPPVGMATRRGGYRPRLPPKPGCRGGCPSETQPFHSPSSLIFPTAASGAGYCLRCQVEILSFPLLSFHRQSVDKVNIMQKPPQGGRLS